MTVYELSDLVQIARSKSAFYKSLYQNISFKILSDLPVIKSEDFWKANTIENNSVLTDSHNNGILFKSGGTTGSPKFSFFSLEEWETFTAAFGEGMRRGGLIPGEKIANLFYAGDLYASFLFIFNSIEKSNASVVQYPLSGGAEFSHIVETINSFKITTWTGVPTSIMKLTEFAQKDKLYSPDKILFGGESLYQDQIEFIQSVFPKTHIQSVGYASVDGGLLGFVDSTCRLQEHRVFSDHTIMEILDEDTLKPILDAGVPGKLFLTNLTRKLMPIIRYPVGDNAVWIDPPTTLKYRKFKILGRSEEGARVGPATIFYDDTAKLLQHFHHEIQIKGFQLRLVHFSGRDQLIFRVAAESPSSAMATTIEKYIYAQRELIKSLVTDQLIHPIKLEFVSMSELVTNARTGKLKHIIDDRK